MLSERKARIRSDVLRRMRDLKLRHGWEALCLRSKLERELQRARAIVLVAVLRGRDVAEARCCEVQLPRLREGRRVGGVEGFGAELQNTSLP